MMTDALGAPVQLGMHVRVHRNTANEEAGAIFSADEMHRYVLWRRWDYGAQLLVTIGLNPSTATEIADDPTIRRLMGFARAWNFGGLLMLNLFSLRSTNPRVLYEVAGNGNEFAATGDPENLAFIHYFCDPRPDLLSLRGGDVHHATVLAAWGAHGALLSRGRQVFSELTDAGAPLHALARTKTGEPGHVLYLRASAQLQPYTR